MDGTPLLGVLTKLYTVCSEIRVPFVRVQHAGTTEWLLYRDDNNDLRGEDTEEDNGMLDSIEMFGLMDFGTIAWLFTDQTYVSPPQQFSVMHMARRVKSLQLAWQRDVKKENPKVQLSVSSGIRAHVFTKKMPTNLQLKLKELANSQNDIMTKFTMLEKIRSTAALKRGWKQEKDKNN